MSNQGREHWAIVKWILWCLTGTSSVCLRFGSSNPVLEFFTDSDMSIDVDTIRSTFGYVMTYARGGVLWLSRMQKAVVLPTTKAEYMVVVEAANEIIWMTDFIREFWIRQDEF